MLAVCPRCKKVTKFVDGMTVSQAGDNGTMSVGSGWRCTECQFTPLFKPEEVKEETCLKSK